ncbi:GAF domain-containing protein [Bacillus sp. ISL-40]|uniref:GAF domain-containing protein n=1 Tax=unclassified Bacillus (in: firmicutes) TaxID=185979 RepID=UPI001BEA1B7D|nr:MULTISPECIES: GAF domain-containing protein [unclassified Bacillus (in: firmicutes)]MBT2697308.1 GAF domain-containing protein [Bacillus sp. ISL-40]MBT2723807.1 GAF domain-containing protein [Bacillus sp. ISL-46]MBT2741875.1 GAF domain-containing protein [Bacillus sp. ISL-77]
MKEIMELQEVIKVCDSLMAVVGCEFVALALQNEVGPDVRWHYASANLNDKYKRITVRFGKGIAGKIISSGSPMMITDFPNGVIGKVTDYPIMLAEKLVSSFAVPLFFNAVPKGVLLIGNRRASTFTEQDQQYVRESAQALEQILKEQIL